MHAASTEKAIVPYFGGAISRRTAAIDSSGSPHTHHRCRSTAQSTTVRERGYAVIYGELTDGISCSPSASGPSGGDDRP